MTRAIVLFSAALLLVAGPSLAQSPQPYAGMQTRPLKALSGDELADLREGRGMGFALAGELNGYPGPKHVLELAAESDLDQQFSGRTIAPVSLTAATAAIGATQGALRATHLKYHLAMMEVLTPEQIRRYGELRGYNAAAAAGHLPGMHNHKK